MGNQSDNDEYPLVGFRFEVSFGNDSNAGDTSFAEVSGISTNIVTEEIIEGGENRFKHRLPSLVSHPPLVLKRGVTKKGSMIMEIISAYGSVGVINNIQPVDMTVKLLDEEGTPVLSWSFTGVYPLKHEISTLNANNSDVLIESIELSYKMYSQITV